MSQATTWHSLTLASFELDTLDYIRDGGEYENGVYKGGKVTPIHAICS